MRASCVALLVALAACTTSAPVPMRVVVHETRCARPVDTAIVLLPGALDHAEEFDTEGFVAAVRERHLAADVILADATIGYYRDGTIVARLDADVLGPARARGIAHVWLAGISLGGLGSLATTNERRGIAEGLLLIAPYLGERTTIAEVEASGGVARWSPPGPIPDDDRERRLWRWVQELTGVRAAGPHPPPGLPLEGGGARLPPPLEGGGARLLPPLEGGGARLLPPLEGGGARLPPLQGEGRGGDGVGLSGVSLPSVPLPTVYLGYGLDDRFAPAHRLFASVLPADHVFTAPGGHDWPAWRAVWGAMLDAAPLPRDASCVTRGPA